MPGVTMAIAVRQKQERIMPNSIFKQSYSQVRRDQPVYRLICGDMKGEADCWVESAQWKVEA